MLSGKHEEVVPLTMHTKQQLVCECGHVGYLNCSENDQPYSSCWERYTLDGFSGGSVTVTDRHPMPSDLIAALGVQCPQCGVIGNVKRVGHATRA